MRIPYILGILRNRWLRFGSWFGEREVVLLLTGLHKDGWDDEEVIDAAKISVNWSHFKDLLGL